MELSCASNLDRRGSQFFPGSSEEELAGWHVDLSLWDPEQRNQMKPPPTQSCDSQNWDNKSVWWCVIKAMGDYHTSPNSLDPIFPRPRLARFPWAETEAPHSVPTSQLSGSGNKSVSLCGCMTNVHSSTNPLLSPNCATQTSARIPFHLAKERHRAQRPPGWKAWESSQRPGTNLLFSQGLPTLVFKMITQMFSNICGWGLQRSYLGYSISDKPWVNKELSFSQSIMDKFLYRMMTLESARNGLTFSLLSSKVVSAVLGKGLSLSELTHPLQRELVRTVHKRLHNALAGQNAQLSGGF